ncbi:hypothetical protein N7462_010470 [Penicillium macrosclerotiorum]|uniref:uncharacterized protein n=1 Tax=Penicillium macrosclerotiorum TaxID=303699 RepID=UPI0025479061|nr:uncharacterized protein N7462_010470 [Penicillium macrosclerotiorum]KAJ5669400.1 hypothetical protein N7462_010470 [Penicillium macrosclerotiorum]
MGSLPSISFETGLRELDYITNRTLRLPTTLAEVKGEGEIIAGNIRGYQGIVPPRTKLDKAREICLRNPREAADSDPPTRRFPTHGLMKGGVMEGGQIHASDAPSLLLALGFPSECHLGILAPNWPEPEVSSGQTVTLIGSARVPPPASVSSQEPPVEDCGVAGPSWSSGSRYCGWD